MGRDCTAAALLASFAAAPWASRYGVYRRLRAVSSIVFSITVRPRATRRAGAGITTSRCSRLARRCWSWLPRRWILRRRAHAERRIFRIGRKIALATRAGFLRGANRQAYISFCRSHTTKAIRAGGRRHVAHARSALCTPCGGLAARLTIDRRHTRKSTWAGSAQGRAIIRWVTSRIRHRALLHQTRASGCPLQAWTLSCTTLRERGDLSLRFERGLRSAGTDAGGVAACAGITARIGLRTRARPGRRLTLPAQVGASLSEAGLLLGTVEIRAVIGPAGNELSQPRLCLRRAAMGARLRAGSVGTLLAVI